MPLQSAELVGLLNAPTGRLRTVLDTDTYNEIDDQFALAQIVLSPERFDLEAIYAAPFFNKRSEGPGHGMELSYDEILRLLERLNVSPEGLVHKGVTDYVGPSKKPIKAAAVDDLISRAKSATTQDPLYVIAIGAISNVASALLAAPEIAETMVVVWLGGNALEWPHNREFNLIQDIGGGQVLLDSGVPLILVPCNGVTSHLHASVPEIDCYVEPHGKIGEFLAQRFKEYSSDHLGWSKEIWDMAPVGWLLNDAWAPSALLPSPKLTDDGFWASDKTRHLIRYVYDVKRDPILKDFYQKLAKFAGSTK